MKVGLYIVEHLNNGHIGTFQLSLVERLSSSWRSIYTQNVQFVHFCLPIIGGCPYLGPGASINQNNLMQQLIG